MFVFVGGIEVDEGSVLVFLLAFDEFLVFVEGEEFAFNVLHECEVFGAVVEGLFGEHSVVDEEFQVVPFLFVFLSVFVEDALQAVGDFLGDIG